MPQYMLIGLCEPETEEGQAAFEEWFINQHIEDTTHCPNFIRGRVYELKAPHLDIECATRYISVYEVEAESYEEAERVLNEWQATPDAWPGWMRSSDGSSTSSSRSPARAPAWWRSPALALPTPERAGRCAMPTCASPW